MKKLFAILMLIYSQMIFATAIDELIRDYRKGLPQLTVDRSNNSEDWRSLWRISNQISSGQRNR